MSAVVPLYERQKKPGSTAARAAGCKCPVIDNHHGKGYRGDGAKNGWVQVVGCPMHAPARTRFEIIDDV